MLVAQPLSVAAAQLPGPTICHLGVIWNLYMWTHAPSGLFMAKLVCGWDHRMWETNQAATSATISVPTWADFRPLCNVSQHFYFAFPLSNLKERPQPHLYRYTAALHPWAPHGSAPCARTLNIAMCERGWLTSGR